MNHVGVCEDYAFLLSYGKYGHKSWVSQRKGISPQISHEWDNMMQFPEFPESPLKTAKNNFQTWS